MAVLSAGVLQSRSQDQDSEYDSEAEEEMRLDCEEKQNDIVDLQAEVRAARLETQQLRMRLQALSKNGGKASNLKMPSADVDAPRNTTLEDPHIAELRPLLSWIAQQVDFQQAQKLEVGLEVTVGGQATFIDRVAQWPLKGTTPELWLSVPIAHEQAMARLLRTVRDGSADSEEMRSFAKLWSLVPGELSVQTFTRPQAAVLLADRGGVLASSQPPREHVGFGALVAPWPTAQALEHFRVLNSTENQLPWSGDRVEVQYEGNLYAGTVNSVDTFGRASVKCDLDGPGVFTISPLCRLRLLSHAEEIVGVAASVSATAVAATPCSVASMQSLQPPTEALSTPPAASAATIAHPAPPAHTTPDTASPRRHRFRHRRTRSAT